MLLPYFDIDSSTIYCFNALWRGDPMTKKNKPINFLEQPVLKGGVSEQCFEIIHNDRKIPGVLWLPENINTKTPLVLLGHGGNGHKRNSRMLHLGTRFARDRSFAAVAIDGPIHGDRGALSDTHDPNYQAMWQNNNTVPNMVSDWKITLDALLNLGHFDEKRVGYWGMSMGTMFGIPFVSSEPRIRAAVLGKAGLTGSSVDRSNIAPHFRNTAPKINCPIYFHVQWDDERFDRYSSVFLFDLIGSQEKELHTFPGLHIDTSPEALAATIAFLGRHLNG